MKLLYVAAALIVTVSVGSAVALNKAPEAKNVPQTVKNTSETVAPVQQAVETPQAQPEVQTVAVEPVVEQAPAPAVTTVEDFVKSKGLVDGTPDGQCFANLILIQLPFYKNYATNDVQKIEEQYNYAINTYGTICAAHKKWVDVGNRSPLDY